MNKSSTENPIRVGIVMPVFNVEKTIDKVLASIIGVENFSDNIAEILIIDNHSDDRTAEIIRSLVEKNPLLKSKICLLLNQDNYGYGSSIKIGFEYFVNREVSHIMVLHGDHQVDPAWLANRLLSCIKSDVNLDLVIASRFKSESNLKEYNLLRILGNYFFNIATFVCTGLLMSDSGTAMILVRRNILRNIDFKNISNSWQFHPQLNILLYSIPKISIKEISMNWSDSEAKSTVPLFSYGLGLLKTLLHYCFKKTFLRKKPSEIFPPDPLRSDIKSDKISFIDKSAAIS